MCPENATNAEDGSDACGVPVRPGTNLTTRYAVIVSFGVFLNGTSLADIAPKARPRPRRGGPGARPACAQRLAGAAEPADAVHARGPQSSQLRRSRACVHHAACGVRDVGRSRVQGLSPRERGRSA